MLWGHEVFIEFLRVRKMLKLNLEFLSQQGSKDALCREPEWSELAMPLYHPPPIFFQQNSFLRDHSNNV